MLSNLMIALKARGNKVIVLTVCAWLTFGAMGATLWNIVLKGIWSEIGAAFIQGILSAAAIFSAFLLQTREDNMTRKREAEAAVDEARKQERKELIFTYGVVESIERIFEQICGVDNYLENINSNKGLYVSLIQHELAYLNTINCMQMSDDVYISAIANTKKITIVMFSLLSKDIFELDKAKEVLRYLKDDMSDLYEAYEELTGVVA